MSLLSIFHQMKRYSFSNAIFMQSIDCTFSSSVTLWRNTWSRKLEQSSKYFSLKQIALIALTNTIKLFWINFQTQSVINKTQSTDPQVSYLKYWFLHNCKTKFLIYSNIFETSWKHIVCVHPFPKRWLFGNINNSRNPLKNQNYFGKVQKYFEKPKVHWQTQGSFKQMLICKATGVTMYYYYQAYF